MSSARSPTPLLPELAERFRAKSVRGDALRCELEREGVQLVAAVHEVGTGGVSLEALYPETDGAAATAPSHGGHYRDGLGPFARAARPLLARFVPARSDAAEPPEESAELDPRIRCEALLEPALLRALLESAKVREALRVLVVRYGATVTLDDAHGRIVAGLFHWGSEEDAEQLLGALSALARHLPPLRQTKHTPVVHKRAPYMLRPLLPARRELQRWEALMVAVMLVSVVGVLLWALTLQPRSGRGEYRPSRYNPPYRH